MFVDLLKRYPALLQLSSFASLLPILQSIRVPKVKECNACSKKFVANNRPAFESALNALTSPEKERMKSILSVQEVCYYSLRNGKIDLTCF